MSFRQVLLALSLLTVVGFTATVQITAQDSKSRSMTFNRDVLPILQKNCQVCHRPGEIAPMSFLTYTESRPWAKAMKEAVISRQMPPWFADPGYGHFKNDRRLSDAEIRAISEWADNGAVEGDAKDKPAPVTF